MNHLSAREIRDLLTPKGTPAPPAGLAERLKSEIPEHFEVAPAGDAGRLRRRSSFRTYLLAAGVLVAFGGAFLAYRVQKEMTPPEAPHRENGVKGDDAAAPNAADGSVLALADADEVAAPAAAAAPAAPELPVMKAEAAAPEIRTDELRRQEAKERPPASAAPPPDERPARRLKARDQEAAVAGELAEAEGQAGAAAERLRSLGYVAAAPSNDTVGAVDRRASRFVDPAAAALPTFAPDAGTAAYAMVRHFLRDGRLPPPGAVRVEQLLNHFDRGGPGRRGGVAIHAEGAPSPFAEGVQLLRFHLGAAAAARVQVELNPEVVARYRLVGYENREGDEASFRAETLAGAEKLAVAETLTTAEAPAAGESGAGHAVTVLYELELHRPLRRRDEVATLRLLPGPAVAGETLETERRVTGKDFARTWGEASAALRLTGLVAEFGDYLGASERTGDLGEVLRRARELAAELPDDAEVTELALLIGRAAELRR